MKKPVSEHRSWLRKCGYPEDIMSRAFHNAWFHDGFHDTAQLHMKIKIILCLPLQRIFLIININFDNKSLVTNIRIKINDSNSAYLKEGTKDSNIVYNNPKAYWDWLLMQIMTQNNINGLFKFTEKLCKICKIYINECSSFHVIRWYQLTNSKVTCSTVNALYYLKCNMCKIETHFENIGFKTI